MVREYTLMISVLLKLFYGLNMVCFGECSMDENKSGYLAVFLMKSDPFG